MNFKKSEYVKPEIEIIIVEAKDILTESEPSINVEEWE